MRLQEGCLRGLPRLQTCYGVNNTHLQPLKEKKQDKPT